MNIAEAKSKEFVEKDAEVYAKAWKTMIDFKEIPADGEVWEMFARDFLAETGFQIETPPDRGADGGKDLLVTERLVGN